LPTRVLQLRVQRKRCKQLGLGLVESLKVEEVLAKGIARVRLLTEVNPPMACGLLKEQDTIGCATSDTGNHAESAESRDYQAVMSSRHRHLKRLSGLCLGFGKAVLVREPPGSASHHLDDITRRCALLHFRQSLFLFGSAGEDVEHLLAKGSHSEPLSGGSVGLFSAPAA